MITRYGYDVFFTVTILCIAAIILSLWLIEPKFIRYGIVILSALLLALNVNFFRDPERTAPSGDSLVLAPADGKIIAIRTVVQKEYLDSEAALISIFMSPLNVHVNRNPIGGTVGYLRYVEGEFFAAYEDKASEKNEQMVIGIEGLRGRVLFKQIAGFVARRIVCTLKVGDSVRAGERFGMIKFGSRVDIFIPQRATIRAKVGDVTTAGETVLADLH